MSRLLKVFHEDISQIKDEKIKDVVIGVIKDAPDYLAEIPSSSTGKYHPGDEICSEGMIIHVKRCVIAAKEIARMRKHSDEDLDILIAGCLLHDLYKNGKTKGKYTVKDHEFLAYNAIKEKYLNTVVYGDQKKIWKVAFAVLLHSGQWTPSDALAEWQQMKPETSSNLSKLLESMHIIDFIVSRRTFYDMFQLPWVKKIKDVTKERLGNGSV